MKEKYVTIGFALIVAFIIGGVLIIMSSVQKEIVSNPNLVSVHQSKITSVYRIHDDEKNVTCWVSTHGLSCIPDNQIEQ